MPFSHMCLMCKSQGARRGLGIVHSVRILESHEIAEFQHFATDQGPK